MTNRNLGHPRKASGDRRLLVTVSIGEEGARLGAVSHRPMMAYASRVSADFTVISRGDLGHIWPGFTKLLVQDLLGLYDRVLYLDADVLIAPEAPDVFALVPASSLGVVNVDHLSLHEPPPRWPTVRSRRMSLVSRRCSGTSAGRRATSTPG